jgi:predicted metal-dependent phosphoesterase TrpH
MKLDLHIHTYTSDGHASPTEVVGAAIAGGLDVIAIADHDTAAGLEEAWAAADGTALQVIPGIEVSTRHGGHDLHILGYWIDTRSEVMKQHQLVAASRREERMKAMVARLQELGIDIAFEEVLAAAGTETRSLGRPHLARALLAGGHTRFYGEAFERYLHDGGPAFVSQGFPTVREGIEMIHAAGGVAIWAHPEITILDREIRHFVEWGLDGVECFRPYLPSAQSMLLDRAARDLGLLRTGGSDWHGPHRGPLGDFYVRDRDVPEFLAVRPLPTAVQPRPSGTSG